jgi:hypothetical protein
LDRDDDADMLMAFVALGGGKDMSGHVEKKKLVSTVKYDFGLPINIEEMIDALGMTFSLVYLLYMHVQSSTYSTAPSR